MGFKRSKSFQSVSSGLSVVERSVMFLRVSTRSSVFDGTVGGSWDGEGVYWGFGRVQNKANILIGPVWLWAYGL